MVGSRRAKGHALVFGAGQPEPDFVESTTGAVAVGRRG